MRGNLIGVKQEEGKFLIKLKLLTRVLAWQLALEVNQEVVLKRRHKDIEKVVGEAGRSTHKLAHNSWVHGGLGIQLRCQW